MRYEMSSPVFGLMIGAAITASAAADIHPISQFSGQYQESFEEMAVLGTPCLPWQAFDGIAELCTPDADGCLVASCWLETCDAWPADGFYLFGAIEGPVEVTFAEPVDRFGGWFANNYSQRGAEVSLYDEFDELIETFLLPSKNDCDWRWYGWESTDVAIYRVRITGPDPSGGHVLLDALQADLPGQGFRLAYEGNCPGLVRFLVTGAEPGDSILVAGSSEPGRIPVPNCPGLFLDIAYEQAQVLVSGTADELGEFVSEPFRVPSRACGVAVIQALNTTQCTKTPTTLIN
ncbi:MAG: hypothetical protein D8M59_13055 [Planctomycetes bacterium]|nr:hypothetical protein [Planctomycetota bacterium]NOG54933.1 hypothetical protein [Planctomycetota bacterium]